MTGHRALAAPRRAVVLVCLVGVAGCSAPGARPVPSTPAPSSTSPEAACTRQVAYWVGESLRLAPDQAFDYQHMGLSGRTYEVVRSLTARARNGRTDPGWVTAQAASECARLFRDPVPTRSGSGGWP